MHLVRARPLLKDLTVDLKFRDHKWEKRCVMPKINDVDLMCREYKLHVRGDLSHLETELISTEHQLSALTGGLLEGKCCSCSCSFSKFFFGAEAFWKPKCIWSDWPGGQVVLGSALCALLYNSAQS